jgi:DNA-binding protein Fis
MCRGSQILPVHLDFETDPNAALISKLPSSTTTRVEIAEGPSEDQALSDLAKTIRWAWNTGRPKLYLLLHDMLERELLRFALAEMGGNQTQVAERLGLARGTIIARMQKYELK